MTTHKKQTAELQEMINSSWARKRPTTVITRDPDQLMKDLAELMHDRGWSLTLCELASVTATVAWHRWGQGDTPDRVSIIIISEEFAQILQLRTDDE